MALAQTFQDILVRIVLLITILFIGLIIGRSIGKVTNRIFFEAEVHRIVSLNLTLLASRLIEIAVYIATAVMITNNLGITNIVLIILAAVIGGLIFVNIVLHVWFAIPNFLKGIQYRSGFNKGHKARVKMVKGVVVKKGFFDVQLRTKNGDLLLIPYNWIKN
jgi:hypothetical protein